MDVLTVVFTATYFYLPAAFANLGANLGKNVPLKAPVDFGLKLRGIQLVGNHKSWGGFLTGILTGVAVAFIQMFIAIVTDFRYELIEYNFSNTLILGLTMSFGALLGDLVESFIKRQISMKPHARLFPFDQIDHIIGSLGLTSLFFRVPWQIWLACLIVYFVVHEVSTKIGFALKLKNVPY